MNHRENHDLLGKGARFISGLFFVFLFFNISNLYSQQIISRDITDYPYGSVSLQCATSPYTGCVITLPPAKYGESYSFTIPISPSVLRSDVNFNFSQKNACYEGSIYFSSNGRIEIGSTSSCRPDGNSFIEINLKAQSGDLTDSIKYYLPIDREPVKIVLALDVSGSMALPVQGGTTPRWEILKNSVDLFTQKLEAFRQNGDLIGLTYFSSEVIQPSSPINSDFIEITSESSPIRSSSIIHSDMVVKVPSSGTAMGKGLLDAKQKLGDNNSIDAQKLVLLFTDGLQNVEPLVNPNGVTLSTGNNMLNIGPCAAIDSVRYFTIGMGGTTLIPEILGQIAQANGGISLSTTTGVDEGEIEYFFQNQFANMLEGGSPQIVARETGILSTSGDTYSFPINANVSKLYFELISTNVSGLSFKLEKGGKDLTSYAKINDGSFFKSLSIPLPLNIPERVTADGEWKLTVSGNSTEKYSLVCYVDDHFLDFDCKPSKSVYTVGEKLALKAKISFAGKPLTGKSNKVQVTIVKPGDDLGDLLAKFKDNSKDSVNDIDFGAETKLLHLMQADKSFSNNLKPETHIIDLEEEGEGIYSATYDHTELSGVYQLIFTVNGEITGFGKIERQKQYSAVFKFGQINTKKSNIKAIITSNKESKGENTSIITFRPKNDFGYYLGPGFLSRIKLSVDSNQGQVTGSKDNLDGSYTYTITNIPQNVKPDLRIMVMDETLYLGKFPSPKLYIWQFLVLILLIIILVFLYVNAHTVQALLRNIIWLLIILWILFMILQRLGIINF
ncbi:MAG TPA: hypothetical protein DIW31_01785 [Bacteroidales bacterium]|nr:hypothetical protein [Bacteroidales bacterium]